VLGDQGQIIASAGQGVVGKFTPPSETDGHFPQIAGLSKYGTARPSTGTLRLLLRMHAVFYASANSPSIGLFEKKLGTYILLYLYILLYCICVCDMRNNNNK